MTTPMVLAPIHVSSHARVTLPVARTLARLEGAVLHVLHISERPAPAVDLMHELDLRPELLRDSVLDQRTGDPALEILRYASEHPTAAIVMCTQDGASDAGTNLSGVAERVLLEAPCPVVVVRPERGQEPWKIEHVLLPHDATPTISESVSSAVDLAFRAKARISIVHVAAPDALPPPEPGSLPAPRYMDQRQHEWPAWAVEFIDRLTGLCRSCLDSAQLHLAVASGEPEEEIVRYAVEHRSDLIVVAHRGVVSGGRGRVIRSLLFRSPCPVMIVRVRG